jgi:hypothetical protein
MKILQLYERPCKKKAHVSDGLKARRLVSGRSGRLADVMLQEICLQLHAATQRRSTTCVGMARVGLRFWPDKRYVPARLVCHRSDVAFTFQESGPSSACG